MVRNSLVVQPETSRWLAHVFFSPYWGEQDLEVKLNIIREAENITDPLDFSDVAWKHIRAAEKRL